MSKPKILVIGDSMLDVAHYGTVSRLSPEAPIPILDVHETKYFAGGAANVVLNLEAMGADVVLVTNVGEDEWANKLTHAYGPGNVYKEVVEPKYKTTVKIRGFSESSQIYRHDENYYLTQEESEGILRISRNWLDWPDAVVLSDYGRGVLKYSNKIIEAFHKVPIYVDPKGTNWSRYGGATLIKANSVEMNAELKYWGCWYDRINERVGCPTIIETRGVDGVAVRKLGVDPVAYDNPRPVYRGDPTGAGDTFLAQLVFCLTTGADTHRAVKYAQVAASLAVEVQGTAVISNDMIETAMERISNE